MLAVFMVLQCGRKVGKRMNGFRPFVGTTIEGHIPNGTLGFSLMYFVLKSVYFDDSAII
jgi:hypothetical protein